MHVIPPFDRAAMMIEAELLLDWYVPAIAGRQATAAERDGFAEVWNARARPARRCRSRA